MNEYEQTLGLPCVWCQPAPTENHKQLVSYEADILACNRTITIMQGLGLDASLFVGVELVRNMGIIASNRERQRLGLPKREA